MGEAKKKKDHTKSGLKKIALAAITLVGIIIGAKKGNSN